MGKLSFLPSGLPAVREYSVAEEQTSAVLGVKSNDNGDLPRGVLGVFGEFGKLGIFVMFGKLGISRRELSVLRALGVDGKVGLNENSGSRTVNEEN